MTEKIHWSADSNYIWITDFWYSFFSLNSLHVLKFYGTNTYYLYIAFPILFFKKAVSFKVL